jgi:hypothetical protein
MRRLSTGAARHRARSAARRSVVAGLALASALVAGGCTVQFGSGSDTMDPAARETPRDRNRLYQQEQQLMERQRQFDRVGPSDR